MSSEPMHQRHIANSLRKSIRDLQTGIDGGVDPMEAMIAFVAKMDTLATRIDAAQDAAEVSTT